MNGWILTGDSLPPELERAAAEAAQHKIDLQLVDPKALDLVVETEASQLYLHGRPVALPDFTIAAFVDDPGFSNLEVLQHLENLGSLCVNTAQTIRNTGDKLRTHQLLAAVGIDSPKTALITPGMTAERLLNHFELPLVLKPSLGSRGNGVMLINTREEVENLIDFNGTSGGGSAWLAQEYVKGSHGRDIRVLVIDRKPTVAMLRQGAGDVFRSNYSQGGSVSPWPMDDSLRKVSQQIIDAIGLNIGGIDLLFDGDRFQVCEVNSMPGFQGIESCHDLNVPVAVLHSIGQQLATKKKSSFQVRAFLAAGLEEKSISARLVETTGFEPLNYFLGFCDQPIRIQETVLLDILKRNSASKTGQRNRFTTIETIGEFRKRMPITEWSDYEADARRMEEGEADLLFPGTAPHFVITSGSSGDVKFLPESKEGALAKAATGRMRIAAILRKTQAFSKGFFYRCRILHRLPRLMAVRRSDPHLA